MHKFTFISHQIRKSGRCCLFTLFCITIIIPYRTNNTAMRFSMIIIITFSNNNNPPSKCVPLAWGPWVLTTRRKHRTYGKHLCSAYQSKNKNFFSSTHATQLPPEDYHYNDELLLLSYSYGLTLLCDSELVCVYYFFLSSFYFSEKIHILLCETHVIFFYMLCYTKKEI